MNRPWLSCLSLLLVVLSPFAAQAGEVRVLVDGDGDPATGCTVTTIEGPFDGVEQIVVTTLDDVTDQVVAVDRLECVDPGTDTFGPPIAVLDNPTPWNVGVGLGTNGSDVVETYLPVSVLGGQPSSVRLAFTSDDQSGGEDALLSLDGMPAGNPILLPLGTILDIPTLSQVALGLMALLLAFSAMTVLRGQQGPFVMWVLICLSASLFATGVLAVAAITLDGDPSDWGADVSASDPEMDAPISADIVAGFASASPDLGTLFFRVDMFRGMLPTANDDTATVTEDDPASNIDVLANDSDPDGFGLTVISVTQPANGTAAVADIGGGPGSGVTYTPDPDYCNDPPGTSTDDFMYSLTGGSMATVAVTVTCVDDPPTITAIADQAIAEDGTTGPLAFTLDDVDTPIGALMLSPAPTSSNMTLVPDGNLTLGGAGANRTIEAVPAANENDTSAGGPTTITVTVTDGTTPVTEMFQVSVSLVDDPPTITAIADQVIGEDGTTGPLAFTIDDVDTPIGSLSLTPPPSSSNTTLVPDANLTLGGAGANRTIEAVPAANENDTTAGGPTTITITVTDGTTPVTEMFNIGVMPIDDPPTITAIADQVIAEDGTTGALAFTIDDIDTPIGSLSLTPAPSSSNTTLVPNANLTLGGAGANRTIEATPAADENDASAGGPTTITVTVTDGTTPVSEMFQVSVTSMNDAPSCNAVSGPASFTEDGGAVAVDGALTVIDPDSANLASATMMITNLQDSGLEILATATGGTAISASYVAPTLTLTGPDSVANFQQVLRAVSYNNTSDDPDTTNRIVACVVDDGTDASPTTNFTVQVTEVNDPPTVTNAILDYAATGNTLLRVDSADADNHDSGLPGRVASTLSLVEALTAAGASDPDSPTTLFVPETAEATDQGGTLTLDDDGDFHYTPPIGFVGIDTETVQVTDGEGGLTPVTLRFTVADMLWYVEDTIGAKNPAGNTDGRSTDAFQTLAAAEAASGAGDIILLFETDAPLDEGITLKTGQRLYGQRVEEEAISLLPTGLLLEEIADTNARPQIHRASGAAVTVDTTGGAMADVEIRHLNLRSGDDDAIAVNTAGTNLATNLRIDENVVLGAGVHGIDVNAGHTTGETTLAITDNQVAATNNAIDVETTGVGEVAVAINGNTGLESSAASGINLLETAGTLTVTSFDGNSVSGDTAGVGMTFTSVTFDRDTSTAAFEQVDANDTAIGSSGNAVGGAGLVITGGEGDLLFDDLDVEATGAGLSVAGSGEVNIGAGTGFRLTTGAGSTVVAVGGPALDLDPLTAGITMASISSTNSTTQGLFFNDVAGTVNLQGGSITGSATAAFEIDQDTVTNSLDVTYSGTITNTTGPMVFVQGYPAGTLTLDGASLSDSGAGANTGVGMHFEDVDGTVNVSATSTTLTQSNAHGIHILGDSDGTINIDNTTITNPAGTGVRIVDGTDRLGGTFDFDNVDVSQATDGQPAMDVQGLNGGSVSFDGASAVSATDGTGIRIQSNAGTSPITLSGPVDLGTGGSRLSDGTAFDMSTNSAGTTVTIADLDIFTSGQTGVNASGAGTLDIDALSLDTASNGRALDLDGIRSLVDADAVVCSHNSDCVQLTNLAATSQTSAAGVALTCTGGTCFSANAARTVEVTGAANTISATNGVGLNMTNTTLGPNDATFRSISASGSTHGIFLSGTGTTNGFNVTGTGGAGTGGTIQNISQDGVHLNNAHNVSLDDINFTNVATSSGPTCTNTNNSGCNAAVDMIGGTSGVALDNIAINGSGQHGINGNTISAFSLSNSQILDAGNANDESAIVFRQLTGTDGAGTASSISNTIFEDFFEDGIQLHNQSGALDIDITGNTFRHVGALSGFNESCVEVLAQNSSTVDVDITGTNNFGTMANGFDGQGVLAFSEGATSSLDMRIAGNNFRGNQAFALVLAVGGPATTAATNLDFSVATNDIQATNSTAVSIQPNDNGQMRGTISGNTIGAPGMALSGSTLGRGIEVLADDNSDSEVTLTGNQVHQTLASAIHVANQNSGNLEASVVGNTVSNTNSAGGTSASIQFNLRQTSTNCVDIANNNGTVSATGRHYRLRQRDTSTVNMERLAANTGSGATIDTFLIAQNTTGTANNSTVNSTVLAAADGACNTP